MSAVSNDYMDGHGQCMDQSVYTLSTHRQTVNTAMMMIMMTLCADILTDDESSGFIESDVMEKKQLVDHNFKLYGMSFDIFNALLCIIIAIMMKFRANNAQLYLISEFISNNPLSTSVFQSAPISFRLSAVRLLAVVG